MSLVLPPAAFVRDSFHSERVCPPSTLLDEKLSPSPTDEKSTSPAPPLYLATSRDCASLSSLSTTTTVFLLPPPSATKASGRTTQQRVVSAIDHLSSAFRCIGTVLFVITFFSVHTTLYMMRYAAPATVWSLICGYFGWTSLIQVDGADTGTTSHSGVAAASALGGTILGAAIGLWVALRSLPREGEETEESTEREDSDIRGPRRNHKGWKRFWLGIIFGLCGQSVGAATLHGRAGVPSTLRAIQASAVGEAALLPAVFLTVLLSWLWRI
ncbi:uncharacterized protein LAESUDRAFT_731768 [Laetiporus sulphureus 93-53]|uniref:Uncharacterized protein n=1 Tax=Laetiporus sulphureus 93-53 TaxID=1314785 RepID=A0A165BF75_9APHY|nr:uncharacterized protein LAESUDRAFT_731768 [Laetiporus sulphureus 93-53]KZT00927.1 hypothetical protein LAESUDRAFT_731768 [Laetiporus sulphureus 93-53]